MSAASEEHPSRTRSGRPSRANSPDEVLKKVRAGGSTLVVYIAMPVLGQDAGRVSEPIRKLVRDVAREAKRDVVLALDLAQVRHRSGTGSLRQLALLPARGRDPADRQGSGQAGQQHLHPDLGRTGAEELVGRGAGPVDLRLLPPQGPGGRGEGLGCGGAGVPHRRGAAPLRPPERPPMGPAASRLGADSPAPGRPARCATSPGPSSCGPFPRTPGQLPHRARRPRSR